MSDVVAMPVDEQQEIDRLKAELAEMDVIEHELNELLAVARVQELAKYIEDNGSEEMKAKLGPFKQHYNGDVATLLEKRTQQNFDTGMQFTLRYGLPGRAWAQYIALCAATLLLVVNFWACSSRSMAGPLLSG